jgi:hypothetical protein
VILNRRNGGNALDSYSDGTGFETSNSTLSYHPSYWECRKVAHKKKDLCSQTKFRRNTASPPSVSKDKPRKKSGGTAQLCLPLASCWFPEDGVDMFLRNVGWLSTDYTALYPRRQVWEARCANLTCPEDGVPATGRAMCGPTASLSSDNNGQRQELHWKTTGHSFPRLLIGQTCWPDFT